VEYPSIIMLDEGTVLTVLARHTGLPWYKVAVEGSPTGSGWVNEGVVEIQGDLNSVPTISDMVFDFPTPSATPNTVVVAQSPFGNFGSSGTNLAANLGQPLHNFLLSQGLAPRTDREGSVFVLDLQTGEHFTLNGEVAYSGMSINKIPVLVSYFIQRDRPLETTDAELVANTMICSENTATNQMMTVIGDGDILQGGQRVTGNMQQLGLGNSYVVAPFWTGDPEATPAAVTAPITAVDQGRTQPDAFNQFTVEEIGWLLGSMYQCAASGTGPLIETFPNQITQLECRQMLRVMSANKIGALIEAGVQPGTNVAHKHGWIADTHGDAGIVFGPEKSYVLAMVYHERTEWLDYEKSFPVLEELARQAWNYFNPNESIDQTFPSDVPATCNIYAEPVIADMLNGTLDIPALSQAVMPEAPTTTPTPNP
jgi:beta-lactamase class A